jgi:hypothetical protein
VIIQENGRWRSIREESETQRAIDEIVAKMKPTEMQALQELLGEIDVSGKSRIADACANAEWEEVPLPIEEWLNSYHHVGDLKDSIYPVLKKDLIDLFSGDYHEVILCLHPDTRVPLLDGTTPTIAELATQWKTNQKPFWVYSYMNGDLAPAQAVEPRQTGVDDYYRVTLDDNSTFTGNARHQMVLRDGTKRMIKDLAPGDSIMPFNTRLSTKPQETIAGYEQIQLMNGRWEFTHRLVARSKCVKTTGTENVVHHQNFKKTDNAPENLRWMCWEDHVELHKHTTDSWRAANPERAVEIVMALLEANKQRWQGPGHEDRRAALSALFSKRLREGLASSAGSVAWKNRSSEAKLAFNAMMVERNKNTINHSRDISLQEIKAGGFSTIKEAALALECSANCVRQTLERNGLTTADVFVDGYNRGRKNKFTNGLRAGPKSKLTVDDIRDAIATGSATQVALVHKLGVSKKTIYNTLRREGLRWEDLQLAPTNHCVVSVESAGRGPVYCMTVPDAGNFAISTSLGGKEVSSPSRRSGVISSNTGSTRWG